MSTPTPADPDRFASDADDLRLAQRVSTGDLAAFDELVGRHRERLLVIARRVVDGAAAEDAVQNTLLAALQQLRAGQVPQSPRAWLTTSCRNAAIDQLRRRGPVDPAANVDAGGSEPPAEQVAEARAELRRVLGAVAALPGPERDALLLRATEGAGHVEIADALEVSPGQARQLLHRARRRLRDIAAVLFPAWLAFRVTQAKAAVGGGSPGFAGPRAALAGAAILGTVGAGGLAVRARTDAAAPHAGVAVQGGRPALAAGPPAPRRPSAFAGRPARASTTQDPAAPTSPASATNTDDARQRSEPPAGPSAAHGGTDPAPAGSAGPGGSAEPRETPGRDEDTSESAAGPSAVQGGDVRPAASPAVSGSGAPAQGLGSSSEPASEAEDPSEHEDSVSESEPSSDEADGASDDVPEASGATTSGRSDDGE